MTPSSATIGAIATPASTAGLVPTAGAVVGTASGAGAGAGSGVGTAAEAGAEGGAESESADSPPEGWLLLNDFALQPLEPHEVQEVYGGQKLPCLLFFTRVSVLTFMYPE